jgi:hypothetical protein
MATTNQRSCRKPGTTRARDIENDKGGDIERDHRGDHADDGRPRPPIRGKERLVTRPNRGDVDRRSARLVHGSAPLRNERATQILGRDVDRHHNRDNHEQDRADVGIVELPDRLHKVLTDAAGADKAEHGRAAHVDLEAKQGECGEARDHLRQRGVANHLCV